MQLDDLVNQLNERAECAAIDSSLHTIGQALEKLLSVELSDAASNRQDWMHALETPLPERGESLSKVLETLCEHVIPNGLPLVKPGCAAYITTAPSTSAVSAKTAAALASPQRFGQTAFHLLEKQALTWLAQLFKLPQHMQGLFTSGGSTANLIALTAARQFAYAKLGIDANLEGPTAPCQIFVSEDAHHSIHKAVGILGLGRNNIKTIPCNPNGTINLGKLRQALEDCVNNNIIPMAIIANAGSTSRGAIDPLSKIAALAKQYQCWFHVDGAYGLFGMLDPKYEDAFIGLEFADSITVDPHKWMGTTIGVGTVFVKNKQLLLDSFNEGHSSYLQSAWSNTTDAHSMLDFGEPYSEMGIELSAPARGVEVWAILKEIGAKGLANRIRRHNAMAEQLADSIQIHKNLELLSGPDLSICCFRYIHPAIKDLNAFNVLLHQQLVIENQHIPSTTTINGHFALRPCYISARVTFEHVNAMIASIVKLGNRLCSAQFNNIGE